MLRNYNRFIANPVPAGNAAPRREAMPMSQTASQQQPHVHGPDCHHSGCGHSKTIRRSEPKIGRNDPCPCGSGKKYKKCCGAAVNS